MATKKPARIKVPAVTYRVPENRDECAAMLHEMGGIKREHEAARLDGESRIAKIKDELAPVLAGYTDKITALLKGMSLWCESHRQALTNNGAIKTVDLLTGTVGWRLGLYKVSAPRNDEPVIEAMRAAGLEGYIRNTPSINKDGILELRRQVDELKPDDECDTAKKLRATLLKLKAVPGLKIERGAEEFFAESAALDAATPTAAATMSMEQAA